jgi:pyruvate decarboxylase
VYNANFNIPIGYAADGYARVKGIGAVVTTGGVGELSLANAQGGAFSEHIPIIHIAGTPGLKSRANNSFFLHHTLANGEYDTFKNMLAPISAAQATLDDANTAPSEVDRVLRACLSKSRPVHIEIPADMALSKVARLPLETALDLPSCANNELAERQILQELNHRLQRARQPCFLIGMHAVRTQVSIRLNTMSANPHGLPEVLGIR